MLQNGCRRNQALRWSLVLALACAPVGAGDFKDEEVRISRKDAGLVLAGTLSLPAGEGPSPAVLLLTGSGGHNPPEEVTKAFVDEAFGDLRQKWYEYFFASNPRLFFEKVRQPLLARIGCYDAGSRSLCSAARRREDSSKCFIFREIDLRRDVRSRDAMGSNERPLPLAAGNRVPGQGATTRGERPFTRRATLRGATDAMGG